MEQNQQIITKANQRSEMGQTSRKQIGISWQESGKSKLAEALFVLKTTQKAYGNKADMVDLAKAWQIVLSKDYSADEVANACMVYVMRKRDMPAPSDLIAIMDNKREDDEMERYSKELDERRSRANRKKLT